MADGGEVGPRGSSRANVDDEPAARYGHLGQWPIHRWDIGARDCRGTAALRTDDPDNGDPWVRRRRAAELHAPAHGQAPRKQTARGGVIDDHDRRRRGVIGLTKISAPNERDSRCSGKAGRDCVPHGGNAFRPGFARAYGISLVRGRDFRETDDAASPPVMIVDDSTASRLFPGRLAVGGRAKFGSPTSPYPWITVVGIIRTRRCSPTAITCTYVPTMYRPLAQVAIPRGWFVIHVRTTGAPRAYLAAVRHAVDAADPTLAVSSIETADSGVRATLLPLRVNAVILSAFALFSLFLAALGVYGAFATLANERTLEIGILMALGATAASVRWRMLRSALGMTLAGVGAGAGIAWASTRVLRAILYTTSPTDPAVFLWSSIVLLASSLIAGSLPSRRAGRVEPAVALPTAWGGAAPSRPRAISGRNFDVPGHEG